MKFAVVEYNSKSGSVWAHSPAKPNYLADPDKEIDPTSFGCYVSALEGEHIPLKGYLLGNVVPVSNLQIFLRRLYRKITGNWPQNYDLSYFNQFDVLMVVHQISDGHEMTLFTKRLKEMTNRPYIVGVPTQPFGILQDYYPTHPEFLIDEKAYMNACDVFLTVVNETKEDWQKLTATPVVYLPQPYPVEYARQFAKPLSTKKDIIFVAGVTDRKNVALGHVVASKLQAKFPQYEIHITDTPSYTQDLSGLKNARYKVQPFLPWQEQLNYLSGVKLIINTDFTKTRGRVQVDAAAVGTVSMGSDSDGQADLFPDFYANEVTPLQTLVDWGEKLLTDTGWYEATAQKAQDRLQKYNYQASKERLMNLPNAYPNR